MKIPEQEFRLSHLTHALRGALILVALTIPSGQAASVWTGPTINYNQPGTNPTLPANQDRLTPAVWLTRAATEGLFNAVNETSYDKVTKTRPSDTEWAYGEPADFQTLTYTTWAVMSANNPPSMVDKQAVVHLISEDIYVSIKFTFWGGSAGGFAYTRSTPAVALPTPAVSITNPVANAVFAAPAQVTIQANATVSGGAITNVQFFGNSTSFGSVQAAPFKLTTGNLVAGNYALTAVAMAAGVSATSLVVNVSVVSPAAVSSTAASINNGQFAFDYAANPGLSYVVERSSNFVAWLPFVTNLATNSLVHFSDSIIPSRSFFYRVGRLPNP